MTRFYFDVCLEQSLNNVSIPASQKDTKYLKSSMLYQGEGILPTSQVVVEFRKKRVYRKKVRTVSNFKKPSLKYLSLFKLSLYIGTFKCANQPNKMINKLHSFSKMSG